MFLFQENRVVFREVAGDDYPEHDGACGLAGIVSLEGRASNDLLRAGLQAGANMPYRSGYTFDDDGRLVSADGAGALVRLDKDQLAQELTERNRRRVNGDMRRLQVARFEFELGESESARESTRRAIEGCFAGQGATVLGWKPVETDLSGISEHRMAQMKAYERLFYLSEGVDPVRDARELFIIGRRINQDIRGVRRTSLALDREVWSAQITPMELEAGFFPELLDVSTDAMVVHGRFATNVLAANPQPFNTIGHNGEINSIAANRKALLDLGRAAAFYNKMLTNGGSDSAHLNDAVDLMLANGVSLPEALFRLMPPSVFKIDHPEMQRFIRASMRAMGGFGMWEGPAGVIGLDSRFYVSHLDRLGLRPLSGAIIDDPVLGRVFAEASEKGAFGFSPEYVEASMQHRAGGINMVCEGQLLRDEEVFDWILEHTGLNVDELSDSKFRVFRPYGFEARDVGAIKLKYRDVLNDQELGPKLAGFGWTGGNLSSAVTRIGQAKPIISSLGGHKPLPILDPHLSSIYDLYLAKAAIITNPPFDPAGESDAIDMSLELGIRPQIDPRDPSYSPVHPQTALENPIVSVDLLKEIEEWSGEEGHPKTQRVDINFTGGDFESFSTRIAEITGEVMRMAKEAPKGGPSIIILSDRGAFEDGKVPIPAVYLVQLIQAMLPKKGLERNVSIVVESGGIRHGHDMGVLIAHGATAVCPYLLDEVAREADKSDQALHNLYVAERKELIKMLSKLGITTSHGARYGYWFSAVGLAPEVVKKQGAKIDSKVGGLDLRGIYDNFVVGAVERQEAGSKWLQETNPSLEKHTGAYDKATRELFNSAAIPNLVKMRKLISAEDCPELHLEFGDDGYRDLNRGELSAIAFRFACERRGKRLLTLRDILDYDTFYDDSQLSAERLDGGPSNEQIFAAMFESHMSLGALGPAAHGAISRGCNRLGVQSANGEGGEEPVRSRDGSRSSDRSLSRQIGTAGWGVDLQYLMEADEICIKIAQGAKPGEGGDLPGAKVNEFIGGLRHVKVGTRLISPPPNHDIYSIEDLKARIRGLRALNPRAKIALKVAAMPGLGGIAEGGVKAIADVIEISGYDASTGAAGQQSINYCGLPGEISLAEVHQSLVAAGVRDRVQLRLCGKMMTAKDFVKARLLGADGVGLGTMLMIFAQCIACRKCHTNTCPTGITTQDWERITKLFVKGHRPEDIEGGEDFARALEILIEGGARGVEAGLKAFAEEVRRECVKMGVGAEDFEAMIGDVGRLHQKVVESEENPRWAERVNSLDLEKVLLRKVKAPGWKKNLDMIRFDVEGRVVQAYENGKGDELVSAARSFLSGRQSVMEIDFDVENTDREFGASLAGEVYEQLIRAGEMNESKRLVINTRGTAGHNFAIAACDGLEFVHEGEMNDSCGQWMSGRAKIVIKPDRDLKEKSGHALLGNQACMSATGGTLYCAGKAGQRLGVRNSGATVVAEGALDYPFEYMTAGRGVLLGDFVGMIGSRMTGGELFIYDPDCSRRGQLCEEYIGEKVMVDADFDSLYMLIQDYWKSTGSEVALQILSDWDAQKIKFVKAVPVSEL